MEVIILREAGWEEALYGLSLSYKDRATPYNQWWTPERKEKMRKIAAALAHRDGGHNKFLESMQVWLDIEAPRYWWSEFDTYRVGVTKQSESTMHTLSKRDVTADDFGGRVLTATLNKLNWDRGQIAIDVLKSFLPESYLQRRVVCTNYKALKNIVKQREGHRLPEWQMFNDTMDYLEHSEFITGYNSAEVVK